MRLTQLDPRWLTDRGRRVGFVFKCPHCTTTYLSCFFEKFPVLTRAWADDEAEHFLVSQYDLINAVLGDKIGSQTVPCRKDFAWTPVPKADLATFEVLSVTPSLDASNAGHWHGYITQGEIK